MTVQPQYVQTDVHGNPLDDDQQAYLDDFSIRPSSFTKTNWKTIESRDEWGDTFDDMVSVRHEAEWRSLLSDETDRRAAIIHVNNYNREKWLKRVGEHGLAYRDVRFTKPYDGFSHRHHPTDVDDPERLTYAVIAENEDVADTMEEAELEYDESEKHQTVGELLNFPDCCMEFFDDVWIGEGQVDPMYEIACNSSNATTIDDDRQNILVEDPEPWANVLWRYFGLSFVTHLPCSWDCEQSHEIAKTRGEIVADHGLQDAANRLWEWLKLPHVWTGHKGIAHVRNRHLIGSSTTSSYWSQKRIVWGEKHEDGGSII